MNVNQSIHLLYPSDSISMINILWFINEVQTYAFFRKAVYASHVFYKFSLHYIFKMLSIPNILKV